MQKRQDLETSLTQRREELPRDFFYFAVDPLQDIELFSGDLAGHYDYVCLLRWMSGIANPKNVPQIEAHGIHAR